MMRQRRERDGWSSGAWAPTSEVSSARVVGHLIADEDPHVHPAHRDMAAS
jgi:hypothetical protein